MLINPFLSTILKSEDGYRVLMMRTGTSTGEPFYAHDICNLIIFMGTGIIFLGLNGDLVCY